MGSIKNAFKSIFSPTASRTTGILVILIIVLAIPLTVIVSQKQQELRQRAASPEACFTIDSMDSTPTCPANPRGNPCNAEGDRCRNGGEIYECTKK